ncbi:CDP-glycerol glycerophosphotransferase family protein [Vagococcus fluvialis]|uniref:CDP-glycerol glycerophosphotransferase family protein n=1 Tax=Vagococcus fluvialis TaxID=2738 RepID=UPI003B5B8B38
MISTRVKKIMKNKFTKTYEFKYLRSIRNKKIKKNTVLLESTHGRDFSGHVLYLCKELALGYPNLDLIVAINSDKKVKISNLMDRNNLLEKVKIVEYLSDEYINALATSQYLINDTTFWSFFNKRPEQVYINIWHGTPLKQLGKDMSLDGFGNVQKNFLASDYLIVSNEYTKEKLTNSYSLNNIANTKVIVGPSPRNSILFNESTREMVREELSNNNKKVFLYMPTYRDEGTSVSFTEDTLVRLNEELADDEILYVKLHPFDAEKLTLDINSLSRIEMFPDNFETYEFLTGVDTLITDYSSIMYDFLCTKRSVLLFTYDKESYYSYRGLYEDISHYPFPAANTIDELIKLLRVEQINYNNEFTHKYIGKDNIDGTSELINYIFNKKSSENITEYSLRNDKENVVFFAGELWDNGITKAFLNTLDAIDLNEKNYILYLKDNAVKNVHKYKLAELEIPYVLSSGIAQYSLIQGFCTHLYLKYEWFGNKILRKAVERVILPMYRLEFRRMFNNLDISHFIHYTGFERSLAVMTQAITNKNLKTSIFYHTDIFEEYKAKKNVNRKVLRNCYESATQVVIVNKELQEKLEKNYPKIKSIKVVDNFLGAKKIREQSNESLFISLLSAPVTYFGGEDKVTIDIFSKQILNDGATPTELLIKDVVERKELVNSNSLSNLTEHLGELQNSFNEQINLILGKEKKVDITQNDITHIYGVAKSFLIDDLFNKDVLVFSNIGRFDAQKGHNRLIKSFEIINNKYPNTRLVIVAPHGPLRNQTITLAKESDASRNIYILGGIGNPYSLLKYCEAFVFTSIYEGLGLVVFESLAVDTDVITVDIPATVEGLSKGQVDDNPVAKVVTNDDDSITKGWLEYIENPPKFSKYDFDKVNKESLKSWSEIIN